MLDLFGLGAEFTRLDLHELLGGQRRHVGIARVLPTRPDFVAADALVSALDVSTQAQVLTLIELPQASFGLAMPLIAHDLAVVQYFARCVAIMYVDCIVGIGVTDDVYHHLRHPYTRALLSAIPAARGEGTRVRTVLKGDPPSPLNPPSGCRFRTRCPHAIAACAEATPALRGGADGHQAACIRDDI